MRAAVLALLLSCSATAAPRPPVALVYTPAPSCEREWTPCEEAWERCENPEPDETYPGGACEGQAACLARCNVLHACGHKRTFYSCAQYCQRR